MYTPVTLLEDTDKLMGLEEDIYGSIMVKLQDCSSAMLM